MSTPIPRPVLEPLSAYDLSPTTGFAPSRDPRQRLPPEFLPWEQIASELAPRLRSRSFRAATCDLPLLDPARLSSEAERERAFLLLTVFASAFVWGDERPQFSIPSTIAVPLCALAAALDRPPILHYASITLHNWRRIDRTCPVRPDNTTMLVRFLGGVDEDWFFMASLGVETEGAPLVSFLHSATIASCFASDRDLATMVEDVAGAITPVLKALDRIREWCDPYVYYHRVRPYLVGWPNPGVVYEGVFRSPQRYFGGSAAQSSLIQAVDAVLGIQHAESDTGAYLKAVRKYMPVAHRLFLAEIESKSLLRRRAAGGTEALRSAYNAAIEQTAEFRRLHIALAEDYVAKPSRKAAGETGTGGTQFVSFLANSLDETRHSRL